MNKIFLSMGLCIVVLALPGGLIVYANSVADGSEGHAVEVSYDGSDVHGDDIYTYRFNTRKQALSFGESVGSGQIARYGDTSWGATHGAYIGNSVQLGHGGSFAATVEGSYDPAFNYGIYRAFMPIDTSLLPDKAQILSATFYIMGYNHGTTDNDAHTYFTLVGPTTQATTTTLTVDDFDQVGSQLITDKKIMWNDSWSSATAPTTTYTAFPLNPNGLGIISRSGSTMIGVREGHDLDNVVPSGVNYWNWYIDSTESFSAGKFPYLEVVVRVKRGRSWEN